MQADRRWLARREDSQNLGAQNNFLSRLKYKLESVTRPFARAIVPALKPFTTRWRQSLPFRVVTVNVLVATALILLIGGSTVTTISNDLAERSRNHALNDSARATIAAQQVINSAAASDRSTLSTLMLQVRSAIRDTSASSLIYVRRQPGQPPSTDAPLDFRTGPGVMEAVTKELSSSIATGNLPQIWQHVTLDKANDSFGNKIPAIIAATSLHFPGSAGTYDLFIAYDLDPTASAVKTISRALLGSGAAIVALIALLSWLMIAKVTRPIRDAAEVTRQIAAGVHSARMRQHGDKTLDVLSANFNEMADTLNMRITELNTLSTMQQHFVSDVSHELRTPLTTIRLASDVLVNNKHHQKLDPQRQRATKVLSDQVKRFESLLTDLLEISRYDAGRVQLSIEPTSLTSLTREVIESLQPLSNSLIEFRPRGAYASIDIDPRRIRRILTNLIGNAIEHGENKPIIVTTDSNNCAVAVTVRDYGTGMTEEQTQRVFDRFWRADSSRKRTLGGTGLGLAIAKEDASVHGGSIDVWALPGKGSSFRLTLPLDPAQERVVSPLPREPDDAPGAANSAAELTAGAPELPEPGAARKRASKKTAACMSTSKSGLPCNDPNSGEKR
ncbi:HAMP domain-containing histidine kinase [Canibacter sp. lx-45]|uniref:MtrAB system histidine kinase MtrB n=1 Tax=Canibacter zhuwentaonis TaxID=2837491 RepID=UPI001BDD1731|nr:MtrAB system histidine kinase MtrB [Canibacter zhuwentaonis]MBT1035791.1 HAMP domain-containing histidine kinase [Canibacter zhuwentaonis]